MTTDDALVTAMLSGASQLQLAIEQAKVRGRPEILYRLRCAQQWLNAAVAWAAREAIEEEGAQP